MITLYDYLPSQNAYKIRLLLNHLKLSYGTKYISIFEGEGQTEQYLSISPTGTVPAITTEKGEHLAESNAILVYLAEGTEYLPTDKLIRARTFQWLCYEAEIVQTGIATLRHWVQTNKDKNRSEETLTIKRELCIKALNTMNTHLADKAFFCGEQYTVADMSIFAYTHLSAEANLPLQRYKNVLAWIDRVKSQEGYLPEIHPYSIDPNSFKEL
ncbi:MAG: glutathione S-transferase family protein [Pseudomonadota bacterium]